MLYKIWLGLLLVVLVSTNAKSQVKFLTLNELEHRIQNGSDTTYVINFWATWCGPCVEELPNFERLQAENIKKPIKVILMSLDFKSKLNTVVTPFVKKHKLKSEVYVLNEPNQHDFINKIDANWSGAIPATLVLNTKKKVSAFYEKAFTYQALDQTLKTLKLK